MARRSDDFGDSVSISGNTVVVGAADATVGGNMLPGGGLRVHGARLRLDEHDPDRQAHRVRWQRATISATRFRSAATRWWSERRATVGGNSDQGAAYVFTEPGSGWANMTQTAKLTASDGAANDDFGDSVSISGNTVVVGAATPSAATQGAAYVFTEPGSGWASMTQTAKLTASDGAADELFRQLGFDQRQHGGGRSADATVGGNSDQGAAYVFTDGPAGHYGPRPPSSPRPMARRTTIRQLGFDQRQHGGGRSGDATVGGNSDQGAAYVFTESGSGWAT